MCALRLARSQQSKFLQLSISSRRNYSAKPAIHNGRPFRLAVIGSGPAGFYTAYKVMAKIENAKVDMYERLPVPFGLVRFGVAPDHPEVKV
jgi:adrenodoxin-NADP+ reductase